MEIAFPVSRDAERSVPVGDRLMVGLLSLKQAMKVRILLPEPLRHGKHLSRNTAGQLLLVVTPDSDSGGCWFDSSSRNLGKTNNGSHPAG